MRRGNLPDGGNDKATWKRSRDLLTRRRSNTTLGRGGDILHGRHWIFHLGLTGEVEEMYYWDVLVTYHWDVVRCFIWGLFEKLRRRSDGTSLLRPLKTSSQRSNKMPWRRTTEKSWQRSTETSLGVLFEMYLRRCWDVQRDVDTTLLRRLVARWEKYFTWSFECALKQLYVYHPRFSNSKVLGVVSIHRVLLST